MNHQGRSGGRDHRGCSRLHQGTPEQEPYQRPPAHPGRVTPPSSSYQSPPATYGRGGGYYQVAPPMNYESSGGGGRGPYSPWASSTRGGRGEHSLVRSHHSGSDGGGGGRGQHSPVGSQHFGSDGGGNDISGGERSQYARSASSVSGDKSGGERDQFAQRDSTDSGGRRDGGRPLFTPRESLGRGGGRSGRWRDLFAPGESSGSGDRNAGGRVLHTQGESSGSVGQHSGSQLTGSLPIPVQFGSFVPTEPLPIPLQHKTDTESLPSEAPMKRVPMERPDKGGKARNRSISLLVNHFKVNYNKSKVIYHYDIVIKSDKPSKEGTSNRLSKDEPSRSDLLKIMNELFRTKLKDYPISAFAYDGARSLYSAVQISDGSFSVKLESRTYNVKIEFKKQLKLSSLDELPVDREVMQGLDVVVREASISQKIIIGRGIYSQARTNLGRGIFEIQGSQRTLKFTAEGLVLCVDHSVFPFPESGPVHEFLKKHFSWNLNKRLGLEDRMKAEKILKGLQVKVTHRQTNQKYTISSLTKLAAEDITFKNDEGKNIMLLDYFKNKYDEKPIQYKLLPCLDLSRNKNKPIYVPMEFCHLLEFQRCPKENIPGGRDRPLLPDNRKKKILDIMKAADGPCSGEIAENFEISVQSKMTEVTGRVLERPSLKLGRDCKFQSYQYNCNWNLDGKKLLKGQHILSWAILDFTSDSAQRLRLERKMFIENLVDCCKKLGIRIPNSPKFIDGSTMVSLDNYKQLRSDLLKAKDQQCQLLICAMTHKQDGYKMLKFICETELGIMTQCCLSTSANNPKNQYFNNLALKINAKLGGSNFELFDSLNIPGSNSNSLFMLIGADVNHPKTRDETVHSIAAVVGSLNCPGVNKYAARIRAQKHRCEAILELGKMCAELIEAFAQHNGAKPQNIIYFRDGVSDGQFDMVLNQELKDFATEVCHDGYSPTVTCVLAKKRHHTRFFHEKESEGNVPPGTVVDTNIIEKMGFDFYLCSHQGSLGTSKVTHYHCLRDDHCFSSDQLQKLIYDLCYKFVRCTKPVSLVPPVYYADLAAYRGRMYYEGMKTHSASSDGMTGSPTSVLELRVAENLKNEMFFV